jgi:energy-coupling factor transport system permease protein
MSTELSRNITFGRYLPGETFLHRMHAGYKVLCWLAYAIALFAAGGFTLLALLTLVLAVVVAAGHIPPGYLVRTLRPMAPFLLFIYAFQILFSRSLYPNSANVWWDWGIFSVTAEGVSNSSLVMVRVILLVLSVTVLTLSTTVIALVDAMERLSAPLRRIGVPTAELALAGAMAMRFVPTLVSEAERLIVAQASRGGGADSGNPLRRLRARLPVLVPLILATLARGHDLTEAMNARCYRGGDGRTRWRITVVGNGDRLVFLASLVVLFGVLVLRVLTDLP